MVWSACQKLLCKAHRWNIGKVECHSRVNLECIQHTTSVVDIDINSPAALVTYPRVLLASLPASHVVLPYPKQSHKLNLTSARFREWSEAWSEGGGRIETSEKLSVEKFPTANNWGKQTMLHFVWTEIKIRNRAAAECTNVWSFFVSCEAKIYSNISHRNSEDCTTLERVFSSVNRRVTWARRGNVSLQLQLMYNQRAHNSNDLITHSTLTPDVVWFFISSLNLLSALYAEQFPHSIQSSTMNVQRVITAIGKPSLNRCYRFPEKKAKLGKSDWKDIKRYRCVAMLPLYLCHIGDGVGVVH